MSNDSRFLTEEDRSTITLIDDRNLDRSDRVAISKAWTIEIKKRRADVASGKSKVVPWAVAKARLSIL
jgi:Putative addiction module component